MVKPTSRLTVVSHNYYQSALDQPMVVSTSYTRTIPQSEEQPYGPRRLTLSPKYSGLDLGWLTDKPVSLLYLEHLINPTDVRLSYPEEEKRNSVQVEVSISDKESETPLFILGVGEAISIPRPQNVNLYRLRVLNGEKSRINVTAYPG